LPRLAASHETCGSVAAAVVANAKHAKNAEAKA